MAIVIDTCSLVMIAKNYLPLDKDGQLYSFLEEAFNKGELLLLDVILEESTYVSQGIAVKKMPFLGNKGLVISTKNLLPSAPKKFSNLVDNNFCVKRLKEQLTEELYIEQKNDFLRTGDAKIIIFTYNEQHSDSMNLCEYQVMTEETRNQNDGKLFKKLPLLCEQIKVDIISVVGYLSDNGFYIEK